MMLTSGTESYVLTVKCVRVHWVDVFCALAGSGVREENEEEVVYGKYFMFLGILICGNY